jgi:adenosylcobinamide-GDP ribazoletransferase
MTRSRPLRDAALAVTQLTALPLRVQWPNEGEPDVASYYVWAGFAVGVIAYLPVKLLEIAGVQWNAHAGLVAGLVLVAWALTTRFLHWDGLADTADGWFGTDPPRRREIASDTNVGAFGVTSIVLVALVEYAAMAAVLVDHELLLLVVPAMSRLAATAGAWLGRPAKPTGLGAAVVRKPGVAGAIFGVAGTTAAVGLLFSAYGGPGLLIAAAALVLVVVVPHLVASRFGGVTGDVLGASILVVEVLMFVVASVVLS